MTTRTERKVTDLASTSATVEKITVEYERIKSEISQDILADDKTVVAAVVLATERVLHA